MLVTNIDKTLAVSIPILARKTGLSVSLLYQLANRGRLPGCRRLGKRFLIHLETFEQWLMTGNGEEDM